MSETSSATTTSAAASLSSLNVSASSASPSGTPTGANQQGPATPQAGKLEAGAVTPQAGKPEARTPSAHDNGASNGSEMSLEDALDALKKERAEAARYRKKAQDYDALLAEQENAKLSETEKLQEQLADLQHAHEAVTRAAQERVVRVEVRSAARDLGLNADLALKLIDMAAVAFDEAGDPTNISELLHEASVTYGLIQPASSAAQQPSSRSAGTTPTSATASVPAPSARPAANSRGAANPGAGRSVGSFSPEQIKRMSPGEYNANRAEIMRQLAAERGRLGNGR